MLRTQAWVWGYPIRSRTCNLTILVKRFAYWVGNWSNFCLNDIGTKCLPSWIFSNHCFDEKLCILVLCCSFALQFGYKLAFDWISFYLPLPQEKLRESLRVCMKGVPWTLLTLAKFFSIGIAVDLKIHLILVALLLLTPPMMTNVDAIHYPWICGSLIAFRTLLAKYYSFLNTCTNSLIQ